MSTISTGAGAEARGHARLRLGTCPDRIGYVHIKQVAKALRGLGIGLDDDPGRQP